MASGKIVRTDDTAATTRNIATQTFSEDAVTKHAQVVVAADAADPTQKQTVDANGDAGVIAAANSGVDIGDVTVNNASGASAVNIQDGGNAITVDGTVTATPAATGAGTEAAAQRVTIANNSTGVLSVDDNGGNLSVDFAGTVPPIGAGTEAAALRVTVATDSTGVLSVDDNGNALSVDFGGTAPTISNAGVQVTGDEAHDAPDAGNPIKVGHKAVSLGADPTEVAANDRSDWYSNRAGVPFMLGGHPNILTKQLNITDANGAQTDTNMLAGVVAATDRCVVTHITATCDNANTVDVQARCGFGAVNTPANDAAGIILSHPGIAAGSGVSVGTGTGIIGIGGDGEELRVTCEDPVTGSIDFVVGYFIISNS